MEYFIAGGFLAVAAALFVGVNYYMYKLGYKHGSKDPRDSKGRFVKREV